MRRRPFAASAVVSVVTWIALGACGGSTEPRGPATLSATTTTALSGTVGTAVAPTPAVRALGQDGEPVQGITVTFQVSAGGGTVANATAVTDAAGAASSGSWVLGPTAGTYTLTASAAGLTPIVFTALVQANVCEVRTDIAVGGTSNGTLAAGDCIIAGAFTDNYALTTTASQAVNITMTSPVFDAFLGVANANGLPVAANDDAPGETTTDSRIKLIAGGGLHTVAATSFGPGMTGAYTLAIAATSESSENCDLIFIERGVTTQQTLAATDCLLEPPYFDDQFFIFLSAGSQLRVRQISAEFDTYLLLLNPNGQVVIENDDANDATTDAQILYMANVSGFYLISASSVFEEDTGAYTLIIDTPGAALTAAPVTMSPRAGRAKAGGRKSGAIR